MGYQITFRPPKEFVDDQLKPKIKTGDTTRELRDLSTEILLFCLKPNDKSYNNMNHFTYLLQLMYNIIRSETFTEAVRRFESDGDIWYCGWNYSHDECQWDLEDTIARQVEDFMILKEIIATPDWFDEHEKFYEKLNEIKSNISGFKEICEEISIYEVMDMLREFDVSDEPEPDEVSDESGKVSDESDKVSDESGKVSDESDKVSDEYPDKDEPYPCIKKLRK